MLTKALSVLSNFFKLKRIKFTEDDGVLNIHDAELIDSIKEIIYSLGFSSSETYLFYKHDTILNVSNLKTIRIYDISKAYALYHDAVSSILGGTLQYGVASRYNHSSTSSEDNELNYTKIITYLKSKGAKVHSTYTRQTVFSYADARISVTKYTSDNEIKIQVYTL